MSLISSIFRMTCPRCRQGEMFEKPMNLKRPLQMHKYCSVCGQRMEPEVGFYYGAMFISYLFIGVLSLVSVSIMVFLLKVPLEVAFGLLILFLAMIFLWNLRFSRSMWIHMVVKYDRRYKHRKQED